MRSRSRSPSRSHKSDRSRHDTIASNERERDLHSNGARNDRRDRYRRDRSPINSRSLSSSRPRSRSIERTDSRSGGYRTNRDRYREDRERKRHHRHDLHSSRDRSKRASRSRSRSPKSGGAVPKYLMNRPEITEKDLEGKTKEEQEMMKLMGFAGFDSTKGKQVQGNNVSAVNVLQKRKYRQYMNRKGGFNRPLDFVA